MSKNSMIFNIEAKNKAKKALDEAAKQAEKLAEELEGVSASGEKAGKGMKGVGKSSGMMSKSFSLSKIQALGLGAAVTALGIASQKAMAAQMEQISVNDRLRNSLELTGASAEEAAEKYAKAQSMFAENQSRTRYGDEDQATALAVLTDAVGDADVAFASLAKTLDVAEARKVSLEDAAKALGQTMTGDIGPLKELRLLRQTEIDQLMKIEDAQTRAAIAMQLVGERTADAAENIDPMMQQWAQFKNDAGDVQQALGDVALGLARVGVDASLAGVGLAEAALGMDKGSLSLANLASAIGKAGAALNEAPNQEETTLRKKGYRDWGKAISDTMTQASNDMDAYAETAEKAGRSIGIFEGIKEAASTVFLLPAELRTQLQLQDRGIKSNEEVAASIKEIEEARRAIEAMGPYTPQGPPVLTAEDRINYALEQQEEKRKKAAAAARAQAEAIREAAEAAASANRVELMRHDVGILGEQDEVKRRELELEKEFASIRQKGLREEEEQLALFFAEAKAIEDINDLEEKRAERDQKAARELERRNTLASANLQILQTSDEYKKAELERDRELATLEQDLLDERLTAQEEALRRAEIEADFKAQIHDLDKARLEELERIRRENAEKEQRRIDEQVKATEALFNGITGRLSSLGLDSGLAVWSSAAVDLTGQLTAMSQAGVTGMEALAGASAAGSDVLTAAMQHAGASTATVAGLKAAFESANAIAAYASGNIPGGVAHTVAAGAFAAVAASEAGASAAKPTAGGASAGAGMMGSIKPRIDRQEIFDSVKAANLEALREHSKEGSQTIINVYENGNYFERDQRSLRRANEALQRSGSYTMGGAQVRG